MSACPAQPSSARKSGAQPVDLYTADLGPCSALYFKQCWGDAKCSCRAAPAPCGSGQSARGRRCSRRRRRPAPCPRRRSSAAGPSPPPPSHCSGPAARTCTITTLKALKPITLKLLCPRSRPMPTTTSTLLCFCSLDLNREGHSIWWARMVLLQLLEMVMRCWLRWPAWP